MIVGVSGYGYSGSSAVYDLLKEYDEIDYVKVSGVFEFGFIHEPDGLLDLKYHLCDYTSKHLKGDTAIRRFIHYAKGIERSFDKITSQQFGALTNDYLSKIIQVRYKRQKGINDYSNRFDLFFLKIKRLIEQKYESMFRRNLKVVPSIDSFISVSPDGFVRNTKDYVSSVIKALGLNDDKILLLDQPFPPNKPEQAFLFFEDPKAIVVDRDPRDLYLTAKKLAFLDGSFIPAKNVMDYIEYYRCIRSNQSVNENVLRVAFEDLLYNYDKTVQIMENFLGISNHHKKQEFFKPKLSIKNTNLKNCFPDEKENIEAIEQKLAEFLFPFEKYDGVDDHDGIYKMARW